MRAADRQRLHGICRRDPHSFNIGCAGAHSWPTVFGAFSLPQIGSAFARYLAEILIDSTLDVLGPSGSPQSLGPSPGCKLAALFRTRYRNPHRFNIGCVWAHSSPSIFGARLENAGLQRLDGVPCRDAHSFDIECAGAHRKPTVSRPLSGRRQAAPLSYLLQRPSQIQHWMRRGPQEARSLGLPRAAGWQRLHGICCGDPHRFDIGCSWGAQEGHSPWSLFRAAELQRPHGTCCRDPHRFNILGPSWGCRLAVLLWYTLRRSSQIQHWMRWGP